MNGTSLKWIKLKIVFVCFCFVVFMGLLLFRGYQLQIAENSRVHRLAEKQYTKLMPTPLKRGAIYDRNGVALAMDVQVASIALHPPLVKDPERVVRELASVLQELPSQIQDKLHSQKKFEWVVRRIPFETGQIILALNLEGVSVVTEYKRYYPNKELAGNLLGAVGYDAKALGGLELSYDHYLKSQSDPVLFEKDARGRAYTPQTSPDVYHDVTLTLDVNLQFIAEKYLSENAQKNGTASGFAIIMNPKTGEILALANNPSFNPNIYWEYSQEKWKNHALIDSFEPGSTFKTVVAAAALQSGLVKPEDRFDCERGTYKLGSRVIHDHESYALLSFSDIIKVSSNIGVTKIAQKIGKQALYDMIVQLGFGVPSGIDFPGEESGSLRPVKNWTPIDQSNVAFGQGVAVTGLQMAQAYATLANSGHRMKPWLLSRVVSSEGKIILENKPVDLGEVIQSEAAKKLTGILEGVTDEGGTGKLAALTGYAIAGKTGTAQKVDPKTKKYAQGKYVSSFIGYVPAKDPQFVIAVVYDTPKKPYYGGVVAAPVFKNIAKEALAYLGIPPEHPGKMDKFLKGTLSGVMRIQ